MEVRDLLRDGVFFDDWANRLWLPVIEASPDPEERRLFAHILAASEVWSLRVLDGVSLDAMPEPPVELATLDRLRDRWLEAIGRVSPETPVAYRTTRGAPFTNTFADIFRHVANHGTYHRGQLRGMLAARGAAFPESDFILHALGRKG